MREGGVRYNRRKSTGGFDSVGGACGAETLCPSLQRNVDDDSTSGGSLRQTE